MERPTVFTNGCFDILHKGHIELLKFCENLGNLYVGLNSDKSVKKLKGESRPYNNENDRKYAIERLFKVEEVIIFDEIDPYDLIIKINPDIVVKGGDYKIDQVISSGNAKVEIFPFIEGYSTTKIIEKFSRGKR